MSWTDERVEQLRQHWIDGKSASQIALLLGHGLTRNAVIGKVHRLGLCRPRQVAELIRFASSPIVPAERAPGRRAAPRPRSAPPDGSGRDGAGGGRRKRRPAAEPQVFEGVVLPMSLRVTIIELKEAMCRWPLGDPTSPDFRYCGSPTASGPYCAHHGRLAYQPAQERRRDRARRLSLR